jgi:peptidyl-prolyl cis-trans isomerase SurA
MHRQHPLVHSNIVHLFAVLTVGLLGVACRSTTAPAAVSADTWAVVNGSEIMRDEVEKAFRRLDAAQTPLSEEEALNAKLNLLEDFIVQEILIARAAALKLEVPESELDTAYNEAKKNIPDDAFQQELTRRNLTAADMRDGLRRELIVRKVMEREVGAKVSVTDQEVTTFFNANRAQFNFPEDAYHLGQIVVTPGPDPQGTNRTGDDATTPQAAAAKAAMLMERLKGGTPFRELATDYSEDPESAPRGGDLGLVPLSQLKQAPPSLRAAVLQTTPGNARVVNEGGIHRIVFVARHERAGQRDLSTPGVREEITQALRARREQLLRTAYLTSARTDADVVNYLARRVVEGQGKAAP